MVFMNDDSSIPGPPPPVDHATRDVREHAAEALRMLNESLGDGNTTATNPVVDSQTTYDIKEAAEQAMNMAAKAQESLEENALGTDCFDENSRLVLILAENESVTVEPEPEMVIGRSDSGSNYKPEIDLTPYGAYRLGLSRSHAILRYHDQALELIDLGSRNGTHLNGRKLAAQSPQRLHDGDIVRLGNLAFRVKFQSS
ncbi:MAG: FHA domain-containing protein [Anaerolineae bacterium]|nr:FHA domain-containing protein [Anaerolineae bacterium]